MGLLSRGNLCRETQATQTSAKDSFVAREQLRTMQGILTGRALYDEIILLANEDQPDHATLTVCLDAERAEMEREIEKSIKGPITRS